MCQRCFSVLFLLTLLFAYWPRTVAAQSGCALRINEIMYHPAAGSTGAAVAEWVELVVASDIPTDTAYFITDQDGGVGNQFAKAFTVPGGTVAGSYIIVNNNGNPANDGQTTNTGIYITISYFMGNGSVELNNGGDEIALYQGSAVDGVPCDYAQYEVPNSGRPGGFAWGAGCAPTNSDAVGVSISLDPSGAMSNDGCDWATSGENSPNSPDLPITGAPHTKGWSNNTTPTAVTLAAFSATSRSPFSVIGAGGVGLLALLTLWPRRRDGADGRLHHGR